MRFFSNLILLLVFVFSSLVESQPVACTLGGSSGECQLCPNGVGIVSGDTFGAEIADTCLSGIITVGTSSPNCPITFGSPTSPSPVSIYHGSFNVYSPVISLGTATPSPGSISIGNAQRSVTVSPGLLAPSTIKIGADASTAPITIGADSPVSPSTQQLNLGRNTPTIGIGNAPAAPGTIIIGNGVRSISIAPSTTNTVDIGSGTSTGSITIGASSPVAPTSQVVQIGNYAFSVSIGSNTPSISIGTGTPSPGSITIGNSAKTITIAPATTVTIDIGDGASSGTITIGRDSATPTAQTVNLATHSPIVNLGSSSTGTITIGSTGTIVTIASGASTGTITIGRNSATPTAQTVNIATHSPVVNLGTSSTGTITISGANANVIIAPVLAPTNYVTIADGASVGNLVLGATGPTAPSQKTYYGEKSATVGVGNQDSPTPIPTQTVDIGRRSNLVRIGQFAPSIQLGASATTVSLASGATTLLMGTGMIPSISPTAYIEIGRSSNEATAGVDFYLANRNQNVYFARAAGTLVIATLAPNVVPGPTPTPYPGAGPVTIGWRAATPTPTSPTPTGTTGYSFNNIDIQGRYHDFYSAFCDNAFLCTSTPTATPYPTETLTVQTNVPSGGPPISAGYDTTNKRYYPLFSGAYLGCFNFLSNTGSNVQIRLVYTNPPTPTTISVAFAFTSTGETQAASCGIQYVPAPHVGTGYFYLARDVGNIKNDVYGNKLSIARIG